MDIFKRFQDDIRAFLKLSGMPITVFSAKVMNGDKGILAIWLDGGGNPTVKSMQRVYDFMLKHQK